MTNTSRETYPLLCKGDIDGFFGLAVDNLVQVLVLAALCKQVCGFSEAMLVQRVLPGIAVSLLIGNLFYSLHAWWVARRDHNPTCTALPYGINTVSMFAFIFFVMRPVYFQFKASLGDAGAADLAWKMGLLACIGSGVIELLGSFVGGWIRRVTPRAALLSALAAIGVIFIAGPFAFQIYERPIVAMLPMMIILVVYFAQVRFPLGLPGGLVALMVGTGLAWATGLWAKPEMMSPAAVAEAKAWIGVHTPHVYWRDLLELVRHAEHRDLLIGFLGVIVPMGLINALGSLQNIESAEAAGDRFRTGPCMAVNGIGSIAAGFCGSCFPTTIYIGHPGWKALGARTGYSILNAVFFTVVFFLGLGSVITSAVPMEAGIAIVLWIGVIITAQSYEATPKEHYAAVAMGFFPAVAALAVLFLPNVLMSVGAKAGIQPIISGHLDLIEKAADHRDAWWPVGIYALAGANSSFVITCVIISAISAKLIDRDFKAAAIWTAIACVLTVMGLQHAFRIQPGPFELTPRELLVWQRGGWPEGTFLYRAWGIAIGYGVTAVMFYVIHLLRQRGRFVDLEFLRRQGDFVDLTKTRTVVHGPEVSPIGPSVVSTSSGHTLLPPTPPGVDDTSTETPVVEDETIPLEPWPPASPDAEPTTSEEDASDDDDETHR
ncbi:MAG: NCS2 family permease [Phycisphaerae bacterium]|nr:NCS2 family permease [Phycisphaerae bacterium]